MEITDYLGGGNSGECVGGEQVGTVSVENYPGMQLARQGEKAADGGRTGRKQG